MKTFQAMPMGSCRIHSVLGKARDALGVSVEGRWQYGYIYNTREILQQIRHMAGELVIPPAARQYLDLYRPRWIDTGPGFSAEAFLIEISNRKVLEWQGFYLQQNSVYDLLGMEGAQRIWEDVWEPAGRSPDEIRQAIRAHRDFGEISAEMEDFLMSFRTVLQTPDELTSDMAEILDRLGREKVVFLSKPTRTDRTGALPADRQNFVREIAHGAAKLGARFFDPTPVMQAFGQTRGFAGDGESLHYTPEFDDHLAKRFRAEGYF